MQDITTYDGQSPFDQIKHVRADGIEGAAEAAYESIFTEKPDRPKMPHESWETLPEFYRNQYRRIARAVIDHVMPHPDLFSQEES